MPQQAHIRWFSILDLSKLEMYDFHYGFIMPTFGKDNVSVCMTDTDSFVYYIEREDVYKKMKESSHLFDFSNYPAHHPNYSLDNKKVVGKMKDEMAGRIITGFVGLRPKMYALKTEDNKEVKRAKG